MKILIIEDNAILAHGLRTVIEEAGYRADVLRDGEQAASYLKSGQYDLLMLWMIRMALTFMFLSLID